MIVEPVSFFVFRAMSTVCAHASASTIPIPFVDGQISLLTSLVIHSWWLWPRVEPASVTIWAASSGLSRANTQPLIDALTNFLATSAYSGSSASRAVSAQIASCSIAVPTSFQLMTFRSAGWYSWPVAGLIVSRTCAYSL